MLLWPSQDPSIFCLLHPTTKVYVEPSQIGWHPMHASWMAALPEGLKQEGRDKLAALFGWLVDPCMGFVRRNCREYVRTSDINLPVSLMHLLGALLLDEFKLEGRRGSTTSHKDLHKLLEGGFVFALVWSVGGSTGALLRVQACRPSHVVLWCTRNAWHMMYWGGNLLGCNINE
jgi:hypothetical protein